MPKKKTKKQPKGGKTKKDQDKPNPKDEDIESKQSKSKRMRRRDLKSKVKEEEKEEEKVQKRKQSKSKSKHKIKKHQRSDSESSHQSDDKSKPAQKSDPAEDAKSDSKSANSILSKESKKSEEKMVEMKTTITDGVMVDHLISNPNTYEVVKHNGTVLNCHMMYANCEHNNNKFYIAQGLKQGTSYYLWTRWGRVGVDGMSKRIPCGSEDYLANQFNK